MKIFCFILSLCIICLSMVPCCADGNCREDIKTEQTDNTSGNHQDNNCNACSPFFSCGACSGFIFTRTGINLTPIPFSENKIISEYKPQFIDNFFAKIWQPPQLS